MINVILTVISWVIEIILLPINLIIAQFLPSLDGVFSTVGEAFSIGFASIGWVVDLFGIPYFLIDFLISFYIFYLTVPLLIYFIKIVVKWFARLK